MSYEDFRKVVVSGISRRLDISEREAEDFLELPISEQRRYVKDRTGKPMRVRVEGIVLLSGEDIDRQLDEALRY